MSSDDWMTPLHPRWDEFCERLAGPEGCNFRDEGRAWTCGGGTDKTHAAKILTAMGFTEEDVAWSLEYFEIRGGYCDCEILFNVAAGDEEPTA